MGGGWSVVVITTSPCHSERSEESRLSRTMLLIPSLYAFAWYLIPSSWYRMRFFAALRMTRGSGSLPERLPLILSWTLPTTDY